MKTTAARITDYCGSFIYSDNQLITIFAGDVRVAPVNVGNNTYWKYEYSMKDHTSTYFDAAQYKPLSASLGNVRVVFAAHSHGQPELLQQTSYYPFGMTMQQQNFYCQNANENKFLYNSKLERSGNPDPSGELQDDQLAGNTLDWYDYGARFYDATLGRWHVVDPLAEAFSSFSAYHYVRNNPIRLYDPNGMADNDWIERQQAMDNEYIAQHDAMFSSIMTGRSPHGNNKKKRNAGAEEQIDDGEDGEDASTGGWPGWEAYAGTLGSAASEMYFSKTYGTWMGKNFKMYKQTWGGNGFTGGKNKFGKSTSNAIKWGGRIVGVYSGYKTIEQRLNGEIGTIWMVSELGTTGISTFGGLYGAAWGVGWELGRAVTTLDAYQEFKFNFWYDRMKNAIGPPSPINEGMWYNFFYNYGR